MDVGSLLHFAVLGVEEGVLRGPHKDSSVCQHMVCDSAKSRQSSGAFPKVWTSKEGASQSLSLASGSCPCL